MLAVFIFLFYIDLCFIQQLTWFTTLNTSFFLRTFHTMKDLHRPVKLNDNTFDEMCYLSIN